MKGIGIAALFAFVAYIISLGLFLPDDLKAFKILAAGGSIFGYLIGTFDVRNKKMGWAIVVRMGASFLLLVGATFYYIIEVQRGTADVVDIIWLGSAFTTLFLSFAYLLTLARVIFVRDDRSLGQREG